MYNRGTFKNGQNSAVVRFCIFLLGLIILISLVSIKSKALRVNYETVEKTETPYIDGKILAYEVVVNEEVDSKELKKIAKIIVNKAKKEDEFSGININFNDSKEYVGFGTSLGTITYAPEGDIEKANLVKMGDYSSMEFNLDGILEKDWSKRPSTEEVRVWGAYSNYTDLLNSDKTVKKIIDDLEVSGKDIVKLIAEDLNLNEKDVKEAILKNVVWITSGSTSALE